MTTKYEDMVERFTKKYGDKFTEIDLDQWFRPFYDSQQRIQVEYVGSLGFHYGTVGITSGWRPTFILMKTKTARSSSVTLNSNILITGINVYGRTYRPYFPDVATTRANTNDLQLSKRCIEHGNIDCRLWTASQTSLDRTESLPIATCLKCSRPFHPNTWEDVAHRHYCPSCIDMGSSELNYKPSNPLIVITMDTMLKKIKRL